MKITGQITVPAPRNRVFEALRNARFFAACVDGVRDLTEVDQTHYRALLETKIAYMSFQFNVAVELTRIEPPVLIEARSRGHADRDRRSPHRNIDHPAHGVRGSDAGRLRHRINAQRKTRQYRPASPQREGPGHGTEIHDANMLRFRTRSGRGDAMKAFELEAPDSLCRTVPRGRRLPNRIRACRGRMSERRSGRRGRLCSGC